MLSTRLQLFMLHLLTFPFDIICWKKRKLNNNIPRNCGTADEIPGKVLAELYDRSTTKFFYRPYKNTAKSVNN